MKKSDLRQKHGPDCEDDALEVKNAMLMTALLAEEQNHQEADTDLGEPERKKDDK